MILFQDISKRYKSTDRLSKSQILFLEYLANQQPSNANAQAEYLKVNFCLFPFALAVLFINFSASGTSVLLV